MTLLVAISGWDPQPWQEQFAALLPDRKIVTLDDPFDRREVHYAVCWKPPAGSLAHLPNLAALFSLGAGVDALLADPRLPDVPLVRIIDANLTARMSEYVVLHCLAHLRQYRRYLDQQQKGLWQDDRSQPAAHEISVGVMGFGVMGQDAARKLSAIGFPVRGWSRTPKDFEDYEMFSGPEGLELFLARTDILVSLLPLTPDTAGLLNHSLFSRLKQGGKLGGPVLIHAGRGGVQVEADILAALEDDVLKAATLDVFSAEPLDPDSPLWKHPSLTLTPHNAAISTPASIAHNIAAQIRSFEAGGLLQGLVDRSVGY
jgi:glyoxylate/hydroxypyruvate reductase